MNIVTLLAFFTVIHNFAKDNKGRIRELINTEVSEVLSKKEIHALPKNTQELSIKDVAFQQKIDSLSLSVKLLSKVEKFTPKDTQKREIDKQRDAFIAYAAIEAQRKTDSLENVVSQLTQVVKSNKILLSQVHSKTDVLEESTKAVKPYYDSVSIVFRTRKTSITGKIEKQSFSSFQYGQVFSFDNTIPDYMNAFTDSKGIAISTEAAKEFLQQKSFWVNSIDLINHNAIIKCTQNM